MSFIITRDINKTKYVYEVTSYWDKKARKKKSHQKILGRLDENGVLISSKTKLPSVIKEVRTVKTKYIVIPIEK